MVTQEDVLRCLPTSPHAAKRRIDIAEVLEDRQGLGGVQGALKGLQKKGMVAWTSGSKKGAYYWYRL
jgi:hypothetical protein